MSKPAPPRNWEAYVRELGLRLQQARIDAGLSQEDLAHRSGLTRTHYQRIERGLWEQGREANPSIKAVVRIAQELGIQPGALFPQVSELRW